VEAGCTELVLDGAMIGGFEDHDTVTTGRSHPIEFRPPIRDAFDNAIKNIPTAGDGAEDLYLMSFCCEPNIDIAKIGVFAAP
jgi:hypothetical protein